MEKNSKIYIAGHQGLVGSALVQQLTKEGYKNLITRTHKELDLVDSEKVATFFKEEEPEYVFLAAAKVGGIHANHTYPAEFIYTNLQIQNNVLHNSYLHGVKKLLFLGSSCMYPKHSAQPMKEEYLLTGSLEETNEAYAVAKIAGMKMCQSYNRQYGTHFMVAIPINLYGINDNFHPENGHVIPAMIRRFHEAKKSNEAAVTLWGTGTPKREFLYVEDLADACVFLMKNYQEKSLINVGCGTLLSVKELAQLIKEVVKYQGELLFDSSKPDGMPIKSFDSTKMGKLNWTPQISLKQGLEMTYEWYQSQLT
jgi:GDP-L-fucose synthase